LFRGILAAQQPPFPARARPRAICEETLSAGHARSGRGIKRALCVSIGGVALALSLEDEKLFARAEKRYSAFADGVGIGRPVNVVPDCAGNGSEAVFASDFESARVLVSAKGVEFRGVKNEYALDSLMRMFLSWELLSRNGFLLHAASVVRNGRAYIFVGKSGAGKSTVASLSPAGSVLTDEISLLLKNNGEWRAFGTPFWGEFHAAGSNMSAPVAGVFHLVKAREIRTRPLRGASLLRALLPNILFFSSKTQDHQRLLEIAGAASEEIPGHTLEFRRNRKFWEVLP